MADNEGKVKTQSVGTDAQNSDQTIETTNKATNTDGKKEPHDSEQTCGSAEKIDVVYKLCDINKKMTEAWNKHFAQYIPDRVMVYEGDIFKEGPAADAIVSPANSFGFMDGGIDMAYSMHFGWQMQERLQKKIRSDYNGELLVGDATIIPAVGDWRSNAIDWSKFNEGQPIKWLVSAPTMRVPMDVRGTANAYLAFRAVILAVNKFNEMNGDAPIRSVLCPGLGTAVGRMPPERCAVQMRRAFETFEMGLNPEMRSPEELGIPVTDHRSMIGVGRPYDFETKENEDDKK